MQFLWQCLFFVCSNTFMKCLSETKPPTNKNHMTPPLSATQLVANFSSPQVRAPIVSQPVYTVANNFPVYRILPQVDCLKTDQNQVCSQTLKSRRSFFSRSTTPPTSFQPDFSFCKLIVHQNQARQREQGSDRRINAIFTI